MRGKSQAGEMRLIGKALAKNGPMTRDEITRVISGEIPPERAFRLAMRKHKDTVGEDVIVASGRRNIARIRITTGIKTGLLIEADGVVYASGRFRRDNPELFIAELQGRPDLHELAKHLVEQMLSGPSRNHYDESRNTMMRLVLRIMLVMTGRNVAGADERKRDKKAENGEA